MSAMLESPRLVGRGEDVLAILNANARRTTRRSVDSLRAMLPAADVVHTRTIDEVGEALERHRAGERRLLLCGGGDGTITSLLNLIDAGGPPVGVLRLGTGNGLANVLKTGSFQSAITRLPAVPLPPPTVHFDLVEVDGQRSHFAGTGWDARILGDYKRNFADRTGRLRKVHESLAGYLYALFTITIPEEWKLLRTEGQARVEITNLGPPAYTLDADLRPVPLPGGGTGAVLYEGPTSVASCSTSPEWGFGFRAHPYARAMPGWLNLRVYDRPVLEAVRNMGHLWRGRTPQPGMHDFFAKRVRMRFSRPVPFQIGGDARGLREELELSVADAGVHLLDWQALPRPLVS